jgi:hypothetical protein
MRYFEVTTQMFVFLCLKAGNWLPGDVILPELIRRDRNEYVQHLQHAHDSYSATGNPDLQPLHALVTRLLDEQLATADVSETSPIESAEP